MYWATYGTVSALSRASGVWNATRIGEDSLCVTLMAAGGCIMWDNTGMLAACRRGPHSTGDVTCPRDATGTSPACPTDAYGQ